MPRAESENADTTTNSDRSLVIVLILCRYSQTRESFASEEV